MVLQKNKNGKIVISDLKRIIKSFLSNTCHSRLYVKDYYVVKRILST